MAAELETGGRCVVGYEANGGFLTASPIERIGRTLSPLPTRDAVIVALALLGDARSRGVTVSGLLGQLPPRFTASDRIKAFPTELSRTRIQSLCSGDLARDQIAIESALGPAFGSVAELETTDGLRITFESGEVVHLRPSGNAPELRCYTEADSDMRARQLNHACMGILEGWREATA
jgi:phosphomannomutase